MAIITAAALGGLLGHAITRKRTAGRYLRAPRRMARTATVRKNYRAIRSAYRTRYSKKNWKRKARVGFGTPRNFSTAKTAVQISNDFTRDSLRLQPFMPLIITKGTDINQRVRDAVILSGLRIQGVFRNISNTNVYINWAVVYPRQDTQLTATEPDFFRDYNANRAWGAGDTNKNGLEWANAQINTDKYVVMRRGKFLLTENATPPAVNANTSHIKSSQKEIDIYVKFGRMIHFDGITETPLEDVYFVHWMASPLQGAGNGDSTVQYRTAFRYIKYFREPKTG